MNAAHDTAQAACQYRYGRDGIWGQAFVDDALWPDLSEVLNDSLRGQAIHASRKKSKTEMTHLATVAPAAVGRQ